MEIFFFLFEDTVGCKADLYMTTFGYHVTTAVAGEIIAITSLSEEAERIYW